MRLYLCDCWGLPDMELLKCRERRWAPLQKTTSEATNCLWYVTINLGSIKGDDEIWRIIKDSVVLEAGASRLNAIDACCKEMSPLNPLSHMHVRVNAHICMYTRICELCAQERLMRTEEGINAKLLNWLENLLINGPNACSQVTETVRGSIISGMKYCSSCQAALYSNWTFAYLHLRLFPSQPSK
jgi:hypothetical protein